MVLCDLESSADFLQIFSKTAVNASSPCCVLQLITLVSMTRACIGNCSNDGKRSLDFEKHYCLSLHE